MTIPELTRRRTDRDDAAPAGDPVPRAGRRGRGRPVPGPVRGVRVGRRALRRQGQPAPGAARGAGRDRSPLRRRGRRRGRGLPDRGAPPAAPPVLQPDDATRGDRPRPPARGPHLRGRQPRRGPQAGGRGARRAGAGAALHQRRRVGLAALGQVRLLAGGGVRAARAGRLARAAGRRGGVPRGQPAAGAGALDGLGRGGRPPLRTSASGRAAAVAARRRRGPAGRPRGRAPGARRRTSAPSSTRSPSTSRTGPRSWSSNRGAASSATPGPCTPASSG